MRAAIRLFLFAVSVAAAQPVPKPSAPPMDEPGPFQKVARPVANPPGGPFTDSLGVTLSDVTPGTAILYTLDGTDPDTLAGGATRLYAGPLRLGATTVLKARAVKPGWISSDVMIESYALMPPLYGIRGWYLDEDGDGRVEKAMVEFSMDLPALPEKLAFTLDHDGSDSAERIAAGPALAFAAGSRKRVEAVFGEPFPSGWTSAPGTRTAARIFAQADPPLVDQTIPLYDSAGPVAVRAVVHPPEAGDGYAQVEVAFSEPLRTGGNYHNTVLWKKADGTSGYLASIRAVVVNSSGSGFSLAADSTGTPLPGDSLGLTIDGSITDILFNAPRRVHWIAIEAGGTPILAPHGKALRPALPAQARRYRRGEAEFDAKGIRLPTAARLP
jgi:hypothetical protein